MQLVTYFANMRPTHLQGRVIVPGRGYARQGRPPADTWSTQLPNPLVSPYASPGGPGWSSLMVPGSMFQWEVLSPGGLVEWSTDWFTLDPRGTVIHMDLGRRTAYKGNPTQLFQARPGVISASRVLPVQTFQARQGTVPGRALPSIVGVGNYYETPDT